MNATFLLSGKTFCFHFTKSTSQRDTLPGETDTLPGKRDTLPGKRDTLPGKQDNISPYEQNKII